MATLRSDTISGIGTEGVVLDGGLRFRSENYLTLPKGTTTQRGRGRGVWGGGTDGNNLATIQYAELSSQGNTIDFGDLIAANNTPSAVASATRICFGGGREPGVANRIQFVEIATTSNATDFGDLTVARTFLDACSNNTRGVFGSGSTPSVNVTIDFITIATTGNAQDFGDSTKTATISAAACASPTRGIFAGGYQPSSPKFDNVIEYITIASAGNATDFGDMTTGRFNMTPGGCSSITRGIFGGGKILSPGTVMNNIDFITIATTGDSTDFGDLTVARQTCGACSNTLRGVFGGGNTAPSKINVIDFIEIATTGNANEFGDMLLEQGDAAASSDSHGGLSE